MIGRREFITLLGGAAAAWPVAARGQSSMPVIGWLSVASADGMLERVADFPTGLKKQGFVEHQNVLIEYRWANEQSQVLPSTRPMLHQRKKALVNQAPSTHDPKQSSGRILGTGFMEY